jgi:hypothetical protein
MKPHVHCEAIKAWADGAEIEAMFKKNWETIKNPNWYPECEYRIKDPYRELKEAAMDPNKEIRYIMNDGNKGRWRSAAEFCLDAPPKRYEIRDKPKTKVKMLTYFTGLRLVWLIEYQVTSPKWKRVPSEDKEIEVEE